MLRSRNPLEILKRLIHHRPFGHVYYTFLELEVFSEWTTSVDFQGISLMTHNAHDYVATRKAASFSERFASRGDLNLSLIHI